MDFIVFIEEILLTLGCLSFIFFCFNSLSESIFDIFESRAAKFEEDLLITFGSSKTALISDFNASLKLQFFINKFAILMTSLVSYLSACKTFLGYKSS
jgi:type IV secretory pathway TrbL component